MSAILDASILKLIFVAVVSSVGMFIAVVFAGTLSALLTLGALELFFRGRIQRSELQKYCSPIKSENLDRLISFLLQRYDPAIDALSYATSLIELNKRNSLIPSIVQMPATTLYHLHHRQICGQLAAALSGEGARVGAGKKTATPLTDILAFLAINQETPEEGAGQPKIDSFTTFENLSGPAIGYEEDDKYRHLVEIALRQIDVIQANLGNRINRVSYSYTTGFWMVTYFILLIGSAVSVSGSVEGFIATIVAGFQYVLLCLLALAVAIMLALGTGVFSGVAFTWLDGKFAAR